MGTTKLDSVEMAKDDLIQAVESLPDTPWMMAIWSVNPNGKLDMRRVTWNFPTVKFVDAIGLLATDLSSTNKPVPNVAPLETVDLTKLWDTVSNESLPVHKLRVPDLVGETPQPEIILQEPQDSVEIKTETVSRGDE